jgi:hypothetical protein
MQHDSAPPAIARLFQFWNIAFHTGKFFVLFSMKREPAQGRFSALTADRRLAVRCIVISDALRYQRMTGSGDKERKPGGLGKRGSTVR